MKRRRKTQVNSANENSDANVADDNSPETDSMFSAKESLGEGASEMTSKDSSASPMTPPDASPETTGETFTDIPSFKGSDNFTVGDAANYNITEEDLARFESMEQFLSDDGDYAALPHPEVFNAYPPEVQRKIMEWTDRDVKARRDDESRRQDALMRAQVERERRRQVFPIIVVVLSLLCGAVTGIVTGNPLFSIAFLIVPLAVIAAILAGVDRASKPSKNERNKPPRV